ncbi:hypothetical protein RFI_07589 [Reticulomyxa filosa]|uniref:BTB domain-containing protein n=1 Tax=Reticulomyxa filosa TaxID=46433 RepID=X6NUC6_RETFI|nr:hypothetical protein RFI_07589 [Reticulomyxa filosa]|eukprot:ETO29533.1 hypothetical protein RFI_07589 [Reticulomyxa filosa]
MAANHSVFHRQKKPRLDEETIDEMTTSANKKITADMTTMDEKTNKNKTGNDTQEKMSNDSMTVEIPAHKSILCAFSPFFKNCFQHHMKETLDGFIEVEDADPYVMYSLIQYMYTETIEPRDIDRIQLLVLADKYQIKRLILLCLNDLKNDINIDNCIDLLILSHRLSHIPLAVSVKNYCVEFITKNLNEVTKTNAFHKLKKNEFVNIMLEYIQTKNLSATSLGCDTDNKSAFKKKPKKRVFKQMQQF